MKQSSLGFILDAIDLVSCSVISGAIVNKNAQENQLKNENQNSSVKNVWGVHGNSLMPINSALQARAFSQSYDENNIGFLPEVVLICSWIKKKLLHNTPLSGLIISQ